MLSRSSLVFALVVLLGCQEKAPPVAAVPTDPVLVRVADEETNLTRLEAAQRNQVQRVSAMDPSLTARILDALRAEKESQVRAHKTLVTVRELLKSPSDADAARADAQQRITTAMTEVQQLRKESEALYVAQIAELEKRAQKPAAPPEEKKDEQRETE